MAPITDGHRRRSSILVNTTEWRPNLGKATGTARILHDPDDFGQMKAGDILVAPIATPTWTPLFAMASAIVTDVGGPLSHGSIVAREYSIPAVLGTEVTTHHIGNG